MVYRLRRITTEPPSHVEPGNVARRDKDSLGQRRSSFIVELRQTVRHTILHRSRDVEAAVHTPF